MIVTIFFLIAAVNTVHSLNSYHLPEINEGMDYQAYYDRARDKFDLVKLKPRDFYLSVLNPYYHRIPKQSVDYDDYERDMKSIGKEYLKHAHTFYEDLRSYIPPTAIDEVRNLMPNDNIYLSSDHDYFEINLMFFEVQYTKTLLTLFGYKVDDYVSHIRQRYTELGIAEKSPIKLQVVDTTVGNNQTATQNNDEDVGQGENEGTEDHNDNEEAGDHNAGEEEENFRPDTTGQVAILSNEEYNAVIELMSVLPSYDRMEDKYFIQRITEIKSVLGKYPFLNSNNRLLNINDLNVDYAKKMAKKTLLLSETYELYVLRMIHLGVIPLHLELCQKEYGAFTEKSLIPDASFFTKPADGETA